MMHTDAGCPVLSKNSSLVISASSTLVVRKYTKRMDKVERNGMDLNLTTGGLNGDRGTGGSTGEGGNGRKGTGGIRSGGNSFGRETRGNRGSGSENANDEGSGGKSEGGNGGGGGGDGNGNGNGNGRGSSGNGGGRGNHGSSSSDGSNSHHGQADDSLALTPQIVDLIPQGSSGFGISDRDLSLNYSAGWDLLVISPHTFHATSLVGSTLRLTFNGTQIIVVGLLPPGNSTVSANYSIDGGSPQTETLDSLSGTRSPVGNTTFFTSPNLPFANHTIEISVLKTGQGRNYTLDYFEVIIPSTLSEPEGSVPATGVTSKTKAGAIVGGVLGAVVLILCVALLYWLYVCRLRRRANRQEAAIIHSEGKDDYVIDPYNYESQMLPGSSGKRLAILPRTPMRTFQITGSLDPTFRSSIATVRSATPFDSETSSQTVVLPEAHHFTFHTGPRQTFV